MVDPSGSQAMFVQSQYSKAYRAPSLRSSSSRRPHHTCVTWTHKWISNIWDCSITQSKRRRRKLNRTEKKTLAYHRRGIFDCEWFTRTRYYGVIKPFTMRFGSTGTNSRLLDAHLLWQAQQNRLKPIKTTWENVSTQQR